jgi:redox-sensitive bicupin YhaK (pirin superfamily)
VPVFKAILNAIEHPIGPLTVNRVMPQQTLTLVGAWALLDHFNVALAPDQMPKPDGSLAHPHRGIATLSYILEGEITHLDSRSHQGKVGAGGVQWMKAGNGIVHDEWAMPVNNRLHGAQFWINLSARAKAESPDYRCVQATDLPSQKLSDQGSFLKVVVGHYQNMSSPIPIDGRQLLLHLRLKAGAKVTLVLHQDDQYAAFVIHGTIQLSGETLNEQEQGFLCEGMADVEVIATEDSELFFYGGEAYQEPVVSGGPFIMNTDAELAQAYRDYRAGEYGDIDYRLIEEAPVDA